MYEGLFSTKKDLQSFKEERELRRECKGTLKNVTGQRILVDTGGGNEKQFPFAGNLPADLQGKEVKIYQGIDGIYVYDPAAKIFRW